MACSWWAWSPVKCTIFKASHGANPARASTITPETSWVTPLGHPGSGLPTPWTRRPLTRALPSRRLLRLGLVEEVELDVGVSLAHGLEQGKLRHSTAYLGW